MDRLSNTAATTRIAGVAIAGLAAVAVWAAPADAKSDTPHTITVTGTAQVKPAPSNRHSEASIRESVAAARAAAIPQALADGRRRATNLSTLSGVPLGELTSIAEAAPSPFGYIGPFGADGTFGPDKYCGTVRRVVYRTDAHGKRKRVATRSRYTCRVPAMVSASLTLVFAAD